jgi:protein-disulfide isomerase
MPSSWSEAQKTHEAKKYLIEQKRSQALLALAESAQKNGEIKVLVPKPQEPRYNIPIEHYDFVLYGPNVTDVVAKQQSYPITIIECSEYQCPYCARIQTAQKNMLRDYAPKIRWVVKNYPLDFHDRARPAARAALCAGEQNPSFYWGMHFRMFENQRRLQDKDLLQYAEEFGVNAMKFGPCFQGTQQDYKIQAHQNACLKAGVTGTPAYFINGRKLAGALPESEFRKIIHEELEKQ